MSITTPTVHVPTTGGSLRRWARHHLGWLLVALAAVAMAAVVSVIVLDDNSDEVAPGVELTGADHEASARARIESSSIFDRSIVATDRASTSQSRRP